MSSHRTGDDPGGDSSELLKQELKACEGMQVFRLSLFLLLFTFDHSCPSLFVQSLDVTLFAFFERRVHKDFEERKIGCIVKLAGYRAILFEK